MISVGHCFYWSDINHLSVIEVGMFGVNGLNILTTPELYVCYITSCDILLMTSSGIVICSLFYPFPPIRVLTDLVPCKYYLVFLLQPYFFPQQYSIEERTIGDITVFFRTCFWCNFSSLNIGSSLLTM